MSYVLNKVLNTDVVSIINTNAVNDTIKTLKAKVKGFQALYDCMVKKCQNLEELNEVYRTENEQLIAKYEISLDNACRYFNSWKIVNWAAEEGEEGDGDGLIFNIDKEYKEDFEYWYSDAKKNYLNWFVSQNYQDFKSMPNHWICEAMNYEIEEFGNLEIYQKKLKEGNDEFIKYVLFIKLQIYLDENEDDYFKNNMKSFYTAAINNDNDTEYDL